MLLSTRFSTDDLVVRLLVGLTNLRKVVRLLSIGSSPHVTPAKQVLVTYQILLTTQRQWHDLQE